MVEEKEISQIKNKDIFTDKGSYCGKIIDVELDFSKW